MKKLITIIGMLLLMAFPAMGASNLYEFYKERGASLPTISDRAEIYKNIANDKYVGSAGQNTKLLSSLEDKELLGFSPSTGYSKQLSRSLTAVSTTIYVTSTNDTDGYILPCSATNKCYFNIEQGSTREERVVCSGVDATSFTSCVRGLPATGNTETGSSTLAKTHNAGSKIIMTNISQFYSNYVNLYDAQTKAGVLTFGSYPRISTYSAPIADEEFAPKKYADDLAIAGSPDATALTKGIGELATQAEMSLGTATGGTGASLLLQSKYATSSSDVATTSVVVTQTTGKINPKFLNGMDNYTFNGQSTFTATTTMATTTFNAIPTTVNTFPTASTSVANKGYVDLTSASFAFGQFASTTAGTGITTFTHNFGQIPRYIKITAYGYDTVSGLGITGSTGMATSTTAQSCTYWFNNGSSATLAGQASAILYLDGATNRQVQASISAITATTVTLNFTTFQSNAKLYLQWEIYK